MTPYLWLVCALVVAIVAVSCVIAGLSVMDAVDARIAAEFDECGCDLTGRGIAYEPIPGCDDLNELEDAA